MEALTVIGLVSNIISFVDFGTTLFQAASEIYNYGDTATNRSYELVAQEMEAFVTAKFTISHEPSSNSDRAICNLAGHCRDLAKQIQELLGEVKPNRKDRWQAVLSALRKTKRHQEKILALQGSLSDCRGQLHLHLTKDYWDKLGNSLKGLESMRQEDSRKVEQLRRQVEELHESLKTTWLQENREDIHRLLRLSEDSFHALVNQRVVESLAFDGMHGRFDAVAEAHYNTFKWILHDDAEADNDPNNPDARKHPDDEPHDENRAKARQSFLSWLSSGDGVFHICGKLGSGKSTLMKFLYQEDRTETELKKWAGDRTLIMASFFFWRPGSKLQKSMDGLMRGLLYEVLKSVPHLVPKVLPKEHEAMASQIHTKLELRSQDIRQGFERLVGLETEKISICFFIDGLDEYEETSQMYYAEMVDKLISWGQKETGNIKLCVSSREYNAFMNRLGAHRIRMQELTERDMRLYIRDKMKRSRHAEYLVDTITSRADGIFLWVTLVVSQIFDLLDTDPHDDDLDRERILEEVNKFPRGDMEKLLTHIIETMKTTDRERAFRTFAIMLRLKDENFHFPCLAYAFIDNYDEKPLINTESTQKLMGRASSRLRKYCKGLVERVHLSELHECADREVLAFCHRSIPEFLESFLKDDEDDLQSFDVDDDISRLLLAYLRVKCIAVGCRRGGGNPYCSGNHCPQHGPWLPSVSYFIMTLRLGTGLVKEPFDFEEQLETALAPLIKNKPAEWFKEVLINPVVGPGQTSASVLFNIQRLTSGDGDTYYVSTPSLIAWELGHPAYIRWKIDHSPSALEDSSELALLFLVLFVSSGDGVLELRGIFKSLLDRGFSPLSLTGIPVGNPPEECITRSELNIWELFVIRFLQMNPSVNIAPESPTSTFFELFLESGADADLAVLISEADGEKRITALVVGKERHQVDIPTDNFHITLYGVDTAKYRDPHGDGMLITLIDIINIWRFEDKERLIGLVKRKQGGDQRTFFLVYLLGLSGLVLALMLIKLYQPKHGTNIA